MLDMTICAVSIFVALGLIYTVYRIIKSIVDTYPSQMQ